MSSMLYYSSSFIQGLCTIIPSKLSFVLLIHKIVNWCCTQDFLMLYTFLGARIFRLKGNIVGFLSCHSGLFIKHTKFSSQNVIMFMPNTIWYSVGYSALYNTSSTYNPNAYAYNAARVLHITIYMCKCMAWKQKHCIYFKTRMSAIKMWRYHLLYKIYLYQKH